MVRKGSRNMQKKAFVRRDMAIFNGIVLLLLIAAVMTLLCFLNNEKELVFLIFACLSFNIIAAYSLGTTKGLYLSIVFVMFFSMYSLYDIVLLEKMGADVYIDFLALLCFPVGGFLGGELSAVVEKNMFKIASVSELEKLVTLDGSTGFYNQQGFFKQLEEEVGRAKRYGTSFSLLLFQISNLQQLQSIYKKQDIMFIKKTVAEIVASKLRFTDCRGILDDGSIGVILPQTESGGLNIVVSKIDTAVGLIPVKLSSAKRMVRVRTSLGYATIENTDTDYKMLYLRAKEDLVKYAFALFLNHDFDKSLEVANMGLQKNARHAAFNRLAMYNYTDLKRFDEALKAADVFFKECDKADYSYLDYMYYGHLLESLKKYDDAVVQYEKAVKMDPTKTDLFKNISSAYEQKNDYKKAISAYQKYYASLDKEKQTPDLQFQFGRLYYGAGTQPDSLAITVEERKQALMSADSTFHAIAEAAPDSYLGNFWRARANSALDPETTQGLAKPFYEEVAALLESKNDPHYNSALVECYSYLGYYYLLAIENPALKAEAKANKDKSIEYWSKILAIDPANATAKRALDGIK